MTTSAFSIRRSEAVPTAWLSVHLFLTIASTVLGKSARDALFLTHYSPQYLTAADIGTTIAAALVIGAQLRLVAARSTRRLLVVSPLCFAVGNVALWYALLKAPSSGVSGLAYLWIGVQASVTAPQASLLSLHVLTLRQAKRLCGLVGSGAVLGWIGGGLLTRAIATRFSAEALLPASGALIALCPVIVSQVWMDSSDAVSATKIPDRHVGGLANSASTIWASPSLRAIACLVLVSSAVTTIVGVQFKVAASQSLGTTDQLAAFFGSFSFQAGLIALAIQALLTSRIVGLGLGLALLVAPTALAAGSIGILFSGTLRAAVLLKGSDQILRYSVDRSAVELLYRPMSEQEIVESKTFIDAVVSRVGDVAGGAIALFGAIVLHLPYRWLSILSLLLVLGWVVNARVARVRYHTLLRDNLQPYDAADRVDGLRRSWRRRRSAPRDILNDNPTTRLDALRWLTRANPRRLHPRPTAERLTTALALEMIGFAVLLEMGRGFEGDPRCGPEGDETLERIIRLLHLIAPDRYPMSVLDGVRSRDRRIAAAAIEYLDVTLPSAYRQLLVPLLERWSATPADEPETSIAPTCSPRCQLVVR